MSRVTESRHLYFAYGSNLSIIQMRQRCPKSRLVGVARLQGWSWVINERGYANVVQSRGTEGNGACLAKQPRDVVFGLVYFLTSEDEAVLDRYEGVPSAYNKEYLDIDLYHLEGDGGGIAYKAVHVDSVEDWQRLEPVERIKALVYVDRLRIARSNSREEYVHRIRRAVGESVNMGVPKQWLRDVVGEQVDLGSTLS